MSSVTIGFGFALGYQTPSAAAGAGANQLLVNANRDRVQSKRIEKRDGLLMVAWSSCMGFL